MAANAAMLKTTPESLLPPAARPVRRAAKTAPAEKSRSRRPKSDDRLSVVALAPQAGEIILDLGCGAGRRFSRFAQARSLVAGIDSSFAALRAALQKFPECWLIHSETWEILPFVANHFDAVLCSLAGEHLEHMHAVLHELHRILKPGGRVVLAVHYPELATANSFEVKTRSVREGLFEVDFELRTGAFRHTVQDYLFALKSAGFGDIRQHKTETPGRQQNLFPEESPQPDQKDFPDLVVLQARRPK